MSGLHTLEFTTLGLGKDGRPTTNAPPNPRGVFSILSTYAAKANKKRSLSREEPVSESPVKKTRVLSFIPAPKPLTIREPASRPVGSWSVSVSPKPLFVTTHSVSESDLAGSMQSLDCGSGASLVGRCSDRQVPFQRQTRSRLTGPLPPSADKSQEKTP